jgi:ubiquitin-conjugating enzyme (huntingtin interacting protein 2)
MLLESPNPKDPQDAEVAKMLMESPLLFAQKAHDWAVKYAGAPRVQMPTVNYEVRVFWAAIWNKTGIWSGEGAVRDWHDVACRYQGYSKDLVDRFVNMGFDVDAVVEAFNYVGIDKNGGEDYELEEAYMGDITARLLGEQ